MIGELRGGCHNKGEFSFGEAQNILQGQWTWFLIELARGFLAGNVFDWRAKEVATIMEKGEFSFGEA